jgi:glycosyltransferase involved in cell wall biosynthesis
MGSFNKGIIASVYGPLSGTAEVMAFEDSGLRSMYSEGGVRRLPEPTLAELATREREMPSITLILATRNAARTLPGALKSIWDQQEPKVEVIVIDAASTDGTLSLLHADNDRIDYWVSEPDAGIYEAWNKGIAEARGEWIGFLGSDDRLLPGALSAYRDAIRSGDPELEYLSSRIRKPSISGRTRILGQPWEWINFRRWMTVAHPGSLHHRSLFAELGGFNPRYRSAGDYELLLRAGITLRAGFLNRVTVTMQPGGISDSTLSLHETFRAQRQTHSLGFLDALRERAVATAKFYGRRAIHL